MALPHDTHSIELSPDVALLLVRIPAGEFSLGSGAQAQTVSLGEYFIGKYPVTNEQYAEFVQDAGHPSPDHWTGRMSAPANIAQHPVVGVSWRDALAFCEWLSERSGKTVRLPGEAHWEKAARGAEQRLYPWGDNWVDASDLIPGPPAKIYIGDDTWLPVGTLAVGSSSPRTDSPFGCADMCYNVFEWCSSAAKDYPYDAADGREDLAQRDINRVLRGATFAGAERANATERRFAPPGEARETYGFRVMLG